MAWQERKAAFLFAADGCWSELPHLYARYGTTATARLIARVRGLEQAGCALVCDSGMQATALVFDALLSPGDHAVLMRQVYNKTRTYLEWLATRLGGAVTIVDDGDAAALAAAIRPETRLVFAETFTNPLVRAQDLDMLRETVAEARESARRLSNSWSIPRSRRRGHSRRHFSIRAWTSSSPAAPRRWADRTRISGDTSRHATVTLATL